MAMALDIALPCCRTARTHSTTRAAKSLAVYRRLRRRWLPCFPLQAKEALAMSCELDCEVHRELAYVHQKSNTALSQTDTSVVKCAEADDRHTAFASLAHSLGSTPPPAQ